MNLVFFMKYIRVIHQENEENFYLNRDKWQISMCWLTIHLMMGGFRLENLKQFPKWKNHFSKALPIRWVLRLSWKLDYTQEIYVEGVCSVASTPRYMSCGCVMAAQGVGFTHRNLLYLSYLGLIRVSGKP